MKLGNVLITGGSGFIGSHLVNYSIPEAKNVIVVDINPTNNKNVEYFNLDIRNLSNLVTQLPDQIDTIFHLAARTSVLESVKDPNGVFDTNVIGTQNILELARLRGTKRFLMASTNAVVGDNSEGKISELSPLRPLTPYGSTKAAGEVLSNAYGASYGIKCCQLRLTNVYGTGMKNKDSIIPRLMRTALGMSNFSIYGDGEQFRDYVNVEDVASAFIKLASVNHVAPVIIGSGKSVTVNKLIELTSSVIQREIPFQREEEKPGEMRGVTVDNSNAIALGIKFETSLEEGLKKTWGDFLENN